jgi:hypothetical protein
MFFETLNMRNQALFIFGAVNLGLALVFLILSRISDGQVSGTNAWYKPVKFALSIGIYAWTMGWFTHYLGNGTDIRLFNWFVIVLFGFEIIYIAWKAGQGQQSHFNLSTPFASFMYSMMAIAATVVTLWTAYLGVLFWVRSFPELPDAYLWGIRLGILLFVVFSLEGFVMGSRLSHTIGGPDGGKGLPFLNWSRSFGDPRVAHFIGMHALQVLPLLGFYVFKNVRLTLLGAALYALLAVYVLAQALQAQPFLKFIK